MEDEPPTLEPAVLDLGNLDLADLLTELNSLTFPFDEDLLRFKNELFAEKGSENQANTTHVPHNIANTIRPGFVHALKDFHPIEIDRLNLQPALQYYGALQPPPPFHKPARWLEWSKPNLLIEDPLVLGVIDSAESFGEPDLTEVQGIKVTSTKFKKFVSTRRRNLEAQLSRAEERRDGEKRLFDTLLVSMRSSKDQSMAAIGEMVRDVELLEQRAKALVRERDDTAKENVNKLLRADQHSARALAELDKVIREKDETIRKVSGEITFLRNFAAEKGRVQKSIDELRKAGQRRYEHQQRELENVHNMQVEERSRLQGMAADRLLALTEQSYDKALDNLDDNSVGIIFKNCQVQDAVAIWLGRDKQVKGERGTLIGKLSYIGRKHDRAAKFLQHYGRKHDRLVNAIQKYQKKYDCFCDAYLKNVDQYERDLNQIAPAVNTQLYQKTKGLRLLERGKALKRAEILRTRQMLDLIDREKSLMEKAFFWAINAVQPASCGTENMEWSKVEKVLRRVFVMMNMSPTGADPDETLIASVQKYVKLVEQNLAELTSHGKMLLDLSLFPPQEYCTNIPLPLRERASEESVSTDSC